MPKDRITQLHQSYGFVEFLGEEDADYAIKVMNMIKVYGKPVRVNKVSLLVIVFKLGSFLAIRCILFVSASESFLNLLSVCKSSIIDWLCSPVH